jgi:hypothetical protein
MRGKIEEVTLGEDSKKAKRVKRLQRRKYNASRYSYALMNILLTSTLDCP